jgi:hypothetical protein
MSGKDPAVLRLLLMGKCIGEVEWGGKRDRESSELKTHIRRLFLKASEWYEPFRIHSDSDEAERRQ